MSAQAIHPRVSVNLVSAWNWDLDQHLEFLESMGIKAISIGLSHLEYGVDNLASAFRDNGLRVVSLGGGFGSLIEGSAQTFELLKPAIDACRALGCPTVYTVTGPAPSRMATGTACERLAACLGEANAYARANGTRLAIEHSSPALRAHGLVTSLSDAIDVAVQADVGITVELQNCWYEARLESLFRQHAGRFALVQYSDFVVGEELRMNRRVPGDGDIPLEWMIGQLLDAGYAGFFDLEILGPAIEQEGYASAIRRGVNWLCERLDSWGV